MPKDIDNQQGYWFNSYIKCPHCDKETGLCDHDFDDWELLEEADHDWECSSCGEEFIVETRVTHTFTSNYRDED